MKWQFPKIKIHKLSKKNICILTLMTAVIISAISIPLYYIKGNTDTEELEFTERDVFQERNFSSGLTESGTTSVGIVSQLPDFDVSTITLTIEEVYVEAGDTVSEGDSLYKISDTCLSELILYYEDEISDAQKDLETAELNYSTGQLEAQYDKDSADQTAASAASTYQSELDKLAQAVTTAQTALDSANTQISLYQSYLDNNTYYTENGIAEKEQAVSDAQTAYNKAKSAYDTAASEYKTAKKALEDAFSSDSAGDYSDIASLYTALKTLYATASEKEAAYTNTSDTLSQAKDTLSQAQKELESATTKYETQKTNAAEKVSTLTASLSSLQSAYDQAVLNQTTQAVELEKTYNEALLNGDYSDTTYESTITTLENAVTQAKNTLETLQEEQSALLSLTDGIITASQDGTLASVTYKEESFLFPDVALVTYYNMDTIDISLEISQSDITELSVGDSANVQISGYEGDSLTGTISSIATAATEDSSRSNVTYTVIVSLDNSDGLLGAGSTASVSFSTEQAEEAPMNEKSEEISE